MCCERESFWGGKIGGYSLRSIEFEFTANVPGGWVPFELDLCTLRFIGLGGGSILVIRILSPLEYLLDRASVGT